MMLCVRAGPPGGGGGGRVLHLEDLGAWGTAGVGEVAAVSVFVVGGGGFVVGFVITEGAFDGIGGLAFAFEVVGVVLLWGTLVSFAFFPFLFL